MPLPRFGLSREARAGQQSRRDLLNLLARDTKLDPIAPLLQQLGDPAEVIEIDQIAIGFDANALLRVVGVRKSYEIIDYFGTQRQAPTIIPGQAVQEFWNNQSKVYGSISNQIRSDYAKLSKTIDNVDDRFADFSERFSGLFSEFDQLFKNVFDEEEQRLTRDFFQNLRARSLTSFAPRGEMAIFAEERARSKTPPGFEDDRTGDFYIWIDYLFGLRKTQILGSKFKAAVLVSNEKKIDWIRAGLTHPILVAEVYALVGVPFEVWDLDKLVRKISGR